MKYEYSFLKSDDWDGFGTVTKEAGSVNTSLGVMIHIHVAMRLEMTFLSCNLNTSQFVATSFKLQRFLKTNNIFPKLPNMALSGNSGTLPNAVQAGTPATLGHSAKLMHNYVHGKVVAATSHLTAVQLGDGHSMIFTIYASGSFQVLHESSGTSNTPWEANILSAGLTKNRFQGKTNVGV